MSNYQHQKGTIKHNALAALIHDPLFKQRVEKNRKGKGSYQRKAKHSKAEYQGASENRFHGLFSLAS